LDAGALDPLACLYEKEEPNGVLVSGSDLPALVGQMSRPKQPLLCMCVC